MSQTRRKLGARQSLRPDFRSRGSRNRAEIKPGPHVPLAAWTARVVRGQNGTCRDEKGRQKEVKGQRLFYVPRLEGSLPEAECLLEPQRRLRGPAAAPGSLGGGRAGGTPCFLQRNRRAEEEATCWTSAGEGPLRHRSGRGQGTKGTEGTLEQGAASGQGGAPPPQSWKPKAVAESP